MMELGDSSVIEQMLEFVRQQLADFERTGYSGRIGVDIPITNGKPTDSIDTRIHQNRKAVKKRDRFPT